MELYIVIMITYIFNKNIAIEINKSALMKATCIFCKEQEWPKSCESKDVCTCKKSKKSTLALSRSGNNWAAHLRES